MKKPLSKTHQIHIKIVLAEQERGGGNIQCFLNVWLRRKCLQKECKDPKESIKFSITAMHCQCGRPHYSQITASNPKHRAASLRFVPGEDRQYFLAETLAVYNLLL